MKDHKQKVEKFVDELVTYTNHVHRLHIDEKDERAWREASVKASIYNVLYVLDNTPPFEQKVLLDMVKNELSEHLGIKLNEGKGK